MDRCAVAEAARAPAQGVKWFGVLRISERSKEPVTRRGCGGERHRNRFPKKHFPVIHPPGGATRSSHLAVTMMREPVVRVANTDISGCDCGIVWGDVPRASAKP